MDEVARRLDAPFIPELGRSIPSPIVNGDLQIRIRSLLISRNERCPPRTPRSSVDYAYLTNHPNEDLLGALLLSNSSRIFQPARTVARLAQLGTLEHCMGATRYDGPANLVEENTKIGPRPNPSQQAMRDEYSFSVPERRASATSGVNMKTHGNLFGRETYITDPHGRPSSAPKAPISPSTKTKHYNLRIVPPKVSSASGEHLRPGPQHVPGSYRSEVDTKEKADHQVTTPESHKTTTMFDDGCHAANAYIEEPSTKAVEALKKASMKDSPSSETSSQPPANSPSRTSDLQLNLFNAFIGQTGPKSETEPSPAAVPRSSSVRQEYSPQEPLPTDDNLKEARARRNSHSSNEMHSTGSPPTISLLEELRPFKETDNRQTVLSSERTLDTNGPQLADVLKELPPVEKNVKTAFEGHDLSMQSTQDKSQNVLRTGSLSLHSLLSTSRGRDESQETAVTPLLPKSPFRGTRAELDHTPKPSPVSRALSMLSEVSARSSFQTPSSHSTTKRQKLDDADVEGARHWIRGMLGRRSTSSVVSPNFTTRPHYREKRAAAEEKRLIAQSSSARSGHLSLSDENKPKYRLNKEIPHEAWISQQQRDSKSFTKVIADLEHLLKEALTIAGKAASREPSEALPPNQQSQRQGYGHLETAESIGSSDNHSFSSGNDEEDNHSSSPRHCTSHDQGRVLVFEPESETRHRGNRKKTRDATPYPANSSAPTRHQSAAPPIEEANSSTISNDWANVKRSTSKTLPAPLIPAPSQKPVQQQQSFLVREHGACESANATADPYLRPDIQPRSSSLNLPMRGVKPRALERQVKEWKEYSSLDRTYSSAGSDSEDAPYVADFRTSALQYHPIAQDALDGKPYQAPSSPSIAPIPILPRQNSIVTIHGIGTRAQQDASQRRALKQQTSKLDGYELQGRHHFSIREPKGFSLSRSHRRTPIARDWSTSRKRYVAAVTCVTTALMGLIIGIYAGEVPAIQYAIADEHHWTILGNVVFFIGLAMTTSLFYPLPLLHGRKPYTLAALVVLLPLQFPQAWVVDASRSPYVVSYRLGLLMPRAAAGLVMGFANINFKTTLLDLFGSSLQSGNPHQETVNANDVRRHGGGMGVWLGIWTWCSVGSIGVGFFIGAEIISGLNVTWGFWITIILNAFVLLLNVATPEVRRSPYRRSMAEVRNGGEVSRRVARGEIKMHLESTGPIWWGEEVFAGHVLFVRMLKQPGFAILSCYLGWIYGQVVMIIVLLGALLSRYYLFHPQYVGLSVAIIPLGALLAVPFQKASLFSRARQHPQRTDSMTFEKRVTWTSHLVRRAVFMVLLPFAGMAYTLSSNGPPTHYMVPTIFAGVIGFLSNLAIAECNGLIMETFDTSDLQPGMTGRPRRVLPEEMRKKRTNFSCFPRVTAGFAIVHTFAFLFAAAATGWGGVLVRHLDTQKATGIVNGILLILTLLLLAAVTRYKVVQIIPSERFGTNILSGPEDEWKPVIIGNPTGTTRRMSLLELGALSRWSEIRRRNKLSGPGR